jgi:flagellar protein FlaG
MVASVNTVVTPIDNKKTQAADSEAALPGSGDGKILPDSGNSEPVVQAPDVSESIEKTIEQISEFVNANARGLRFRVDDSSGRMVVTVLNTNSGEVIRQIPSEEFLHLASQLRRYGEVHLVDKEV